MNLLLKFSIRFANDCENVCRGEYGIIVHNYIIMENVTLKNISEKLGLSISTVSRALKNHPDISSNTKKRVNELADFLEYEPNINAINLRSQKNKLFGLLTPSIQGYFYNSFISSVEEVCRKHDYTLMVLQSGNDTELEQTALKICRQNRISGLFACITDQTKDLQYYDKFIHSDIPLVFFDKVPQDTQYDKVCIPNEIAAAAAAKLILKKKKRRILAIFGNRDLAISTLRREAFVNEVNKKPNVQLHTEYCSTTDSAEKITSLYFSNSEKPDAVFCMSDDILQGVMKSLQKNKIQIPAQAGVIALSDGMLPKLFTPEVTYIETSGYALGKLAANRMFERLAGKTEPKELFVETRLVEGGTL